MIVSSHNRVSRVGRVSVSHRKTVDPSNNCASEHLCNTSATLANKRSNYLQHFLIYSNLISNNSIDG